MQLRYPMEKVKASEAHFKLFAAEVPVKQQVGLEPNIAASLSISTTP